MSSDVRKIIYGTLLAFLLVIGLWIGFLFTVACGGTFGCTRGDATPVRTSVATLPAATLPSPGSAGAGSGEIPVAATLIESAAGGVEVARPSNPGGPGEAVLLAGDAASGAELFTNNCVLCHGELGKQGVDNPGSEDGSVPPLNPIDSTLVSPDYQEYAQNIDLFLQHGSRPAGDAPAKVMPAWGDEGVLTQQQIADLIAYVISLNP